MCEDSAWIKIHWNNIWLRAPSHMSSHYTWGFVTTLHDFGGVLGRPLDTFFWAVTISWSRFLARVWSGLDILPCLPSRVVLDNSPTIPTNIIHTCHVRCYVAFSFCENVIMGCSLILSLFKAKVGFWHSQTMIIKDSQEPWPNGFCVRYVGVIWFVFHVRQLLPFRFTQKLVLH